MTESISLAKTPSTRSAGFELWMTRVLDRASQAEHEWEEDAVHDLRVALRRCRAMAEALEEVNPCPGWKRLKKSSRDLFHALGELRDVQVERGWLKKLGASGDPVRRHMLGLLTAQERASRKKAVEALESFQRKSWKKLARKLAPKVEFFPLESVVFQRLALTRLNAAAELFQKARKSRSSAAWHRLRIGLKHFRYIVENFLPQRSEVWSADLKRMQDLLGDIHDIDVLRTQIRRHAAKLNPDAIAAWNDKLDAKRREWLEEFMRMSTGSNSPWLAWRAGFQWGHALVAASVQERRTA